MFPDLIFSVKVEMRVRRKRYFFVEREDGKQARVNVLNLIGFEGAVARSWSQKCW